MRRSAPDIRFDGRCAPGVLYRFATGARATVRVHGMVRVFPVRVALQDHTTMPDSAIHTLRLSPELRDRMVIHLVRAAPNEGVGLLAVVRKANVAETVAFFPGENIDASPTRFTMHPRDVATALDAIADQGWELGAIVHSHLKGSASPSRTDIGESQYPDALMVIVSLAHLPPDLRAWRPDRVGDGVVMRRVTIEITELALSERDA